MNALYWFALVVGVGMFLFSLAGDLFGHGDVDVGTDVDVDADIGLDADAGADVDHDGDGHHDTEGFRIFSVRNATYFLFAFGVTGVLLSWIWGGARPLLTAAFASVLGLTGGAISTLAFGWVRRTEAGQLMGDRGWIGLTGRVTLPLSAGGTGKVLVERGGREHELLARPFEREPDRPEDWVEVMVIDMQQGVALVSPRDPALDNPGMRSITPRSES